jgi:SAM-dependent methyltransferase
MHARRVEPELMDDPALDRTAHLGALAGLARLNRVSSSARFVWLQIADLVPAAPAPPLRLLDVATGSADVPVALALRARRRGAALSIVAADVSPTALDAARRRADAVGIDLELVLLDALRDPLPGPADVVLVSLFLHHLGDDDAVALLRKAALAARRRLVVHDLARGRWNALLVGATARLVTRSPIVRTDSVRSVRAAFTAGELLALAGRAGIEGASVRPHRPFRLVLRWDRR